MSTLHAALSSDTPNSLVFIHFSFHFLPFSFSLHMPLSNSFAYFFYTNIALTPDSPLYSKFILVSLCLSFSFLLSISLSHVILSLSLSIPSTYTHSHRYTHTHTHTHKCRKYWLIFPMVSAIHSASLAAAMYWSKAPAVLS